MPSSCLRLGVIGPLVFCGRPVMWSEVAFLEMLTIILLRVLKVQTGSIGKIKKALSL